MNEEEREAIENTKKKIEATQKGLEEGKYYGERFNLEQEIKREQTLLNLIDKLQKELEEKTTILMVGAEKVKQLEKENQKLKECHFKYEEMTGIDLLLGE